jgi:hypothetical protein
MVPLALTSTDIAAGADQLSQHPWTFLEDECDYDDSGWTSLRIKMPGTYRLRVGLHREDKVTKKREEVAKLWSDDFVVKAGTSAMEQ